jgi:hypothetical protein
MYGAGMGTLRLIVQVDGNDTKVSEMPNDILSGLNGVGNRKMVYCMSFSSHHY